MSFMGLWPAGHYNILLKIWILNQPPAPIPLDIPIDLYKILTVCKPPGRLGKFLPPTYLIVWSIEEPMEIGARARFGIQNKTHTLAHIICPKWLEWRMKGIWLRAWPPRWAPPGGSGDLLYLVGIRLSDNSCHLLKERERKTEKETGIILTCNVWIYLLLDITSR